MKNRTELEMEVLSLIINGKETGVEIASRLSADMFFSDKHKLIFESISLLVEAGLTPDGITVQANLRDRGKMGEVGIRYFTECSDPQYAPSISNAEHFMNRIFEYHQRDRLANYANGILTDMGKEEDTGLLLSRKTEEFFDLNITPQKMKIVRLGDLGERVMEMSERASNSGGMIGLPTGFPSLDNNLLGLQNGYLILIAGRPTVGKSSLMLNMAEYISLKKGIPSIVFSLEMAGTSIYHRVIASQSELSARQVRIGKLEKDEWPVLSGFIGNLDSKPFYLADVPGVNIPQIMVLSRRALMQFGIKVLFIDYLQLITTSGGFGSRNEEVSFISRSLKNLARELDIPVVAASQLSRLGSEREPRLSDLRDSGSLEQDADQVIFIHRWHEDGMMKHKLNIAKARNEETGTIPIVFNPAKTKFAEEYHG